MEAKLDKRSQLRFIAEEKLKILQESNFGSMIINEVCRRHGISAYPNITIFNSIKFCCLSKASS